MLWLVIGGGLLLFWLLPRLFRLPRPVAARSAPARSSSLSWLIPLAVVLCVLYVGDHPETLSTVGQLLAPVERAVSALVSGALASTSSPSSITPATPARPSPVPPTPTPTPSPSPTPSPVPTRAPLVPTVATTQGATDAPLTVADGMTMVVYDVGGAVLVTILLLLAAILLVKARSRGRAYRNSALLASEPEDEDPWVRTCPECGQLGTLHEYRYRKGVARVTSTLCTDCAQQLNAAPIA